MKDDLVYINLAFIEAQKARKRDEVPVGAIIVKNDKIIARAYNKKEKDKIATHHAEILAIEKANRKIKNWRLNNCIMYVTLEPCAMCYAAIKEARIEKVIYAISNQNKSEHIAIVSQQIECEKTKQKHQQILVDFFKNKRK